MTKNKKIVATKKTVISQHIETDMLSVIDRQAEKRGMSRTAMINMMLSDSLNGMNADNSELDPVTCPMEELERVIAILKLSRVEKDKLQCKFLEGARHVRIIARAATGGLVY